jgi:hypothetical protein
VGVSIKATPQCPFISEITPSFTERLINNAHISDRQAAGAATEGAGGGGSNRGRFFFGIDVNVPAAAAAAAAAAARFGAAKFGATLNAVVFLALMSPSTDAVAASRGRFAVGAAAAEPPETAPSAAAAALLKVWWSAGFSLAKRLAGTGATPCGGGDKRLSGGVALGREGWL